MKSYEIYDESRRSCVEVVCRVDAAVVAVGAAAVAAAAAGAAAAAVDLLGVVAAVVVGCLREKAMKSSSHAFISISMKPSL